MKTKRTTALAIAAFTTLTAYSADHLDAPNLTSPGNDGRVDINDVYAFQSTENTNHAVMIMTVNPIFGGDFHPEASYDFNIDTDGDAKADQRYKVQFDDSESGQTMKVLQVPGGGVIGRGDVGETIPLDGGGVVTAGTYDDPFFFDLVAFLGAEGRTFCDGNSEDFFAGLNVSAIVLEVPRANLGTDMVGVWARTELNGKQVDRMGRPAINTVFIPNEAKNDFNEGKPRKDAKDYAQYLEPFNLQGVLLPDILTVNYASPAGFLNGRGLADDVIDIELTILFGAGSSDCVDANDVPFSPIHPYLAPAH